MKITVIRSVLATKILLLPGLRRGSRWEGKLAETSGRLCAETPLPFHTLLVLDAFGVLISSVFGAWTLSSSTRCPGSFKACFHHGCALRCVALRGEG